MIIPSFNNLKELKECLFSIKKQTYKNYEVLVIDGDSSDGTKEFLKTLDAPFFYLSEKDEGIYDAMNKGISKSKGNWLYFLGTDDKFYDKDVLKNIATFFEEKDLELIFGKVDYKIKGFYPFIYSKNKTEKKATWNWKIWIRNSVHHQATFYKKSLFVNTKYSLKYKILSDYAMNINLYKRKLSYKIIEVFIAQCLSSGVSKMGKWNMYKEETKLKTEASSMVFYPVFYILSSCKFFLKKIQYAVK
ncbi:glycosyltransferase family 2 protein [Tenacibaculum sp. E3R01]|uniref:glycosyltransferase family 2 protein n=1 Tax=Tenacibaculum sp. E3R01 TaxID=2267227 RepID=UPI0021013B94|nr:glycosyltransferase family 2 protein [Tenacibaculum sp. E3R01]